ncbi:MAG: hypothetical protein A2451_02980 [Bdellovibrionales bacterium RIFOXYC2_FULL_39_8]|nr:MAG: hypothetical protein A2485_05945 [Bdellovibrionales bacterium RIFOXYC12_FULL_39_17]OFZ73108.1 MAG: hypothetical protein A2451_02980 [Bdellovibrionales bacterium RIFOXYC2_FULL_39_8]
MVDKNTIKATPKKVKTKLDFFIGINLACFAVWIKKEIQEVPSCEKIICLNFQIGRPKHFSFVIFVFCGEKGFVLFF